MTHETNPQGEILPVSAHRLVLYMDEMLTRLEKVGERITAYADEKHIVIESNDDDSSI